MATMNTFTGFESNKTSGLSTLFNLITLESSNATDNVTMLPSLGQRPHVPVFSILLFMLGVVGNILAIGVIIQSKKQHKWAVFHRLVIALALTDLIGILTTSPVVFAFFAGKVDLRTDDSLCHYMAFMMIFAGLATVLLVCAMALDRYLAVLHPLKYFTFHSYNFVNVVIFLIWLFSLIMAILPLFGISKSVAYFPYSWCFFNFFSNRVVDKIYTYFYAILGLAAICMTALMNICVIVGFIYGRRSISRRVSTANKERSRKDMYTTVFLVAIFLVFTICWTPFMVRIIINQSRLVPENKKADLIALFLASCNQVLDPWVYLLFRQEMIKRFVNFIENSRVGVALRRFASSTGRVKRKSLGRKMNIKDTHVRSFAQIQKDKCIEVNKSSEDNINTETDNLIDKHTNKNMRENRCEGLDAEKIVMKILREEF
ncbi:prostaglandin E2 receptor EP4 subtype-like [Mytilus californianus]|uniref:prostaglandin E2 receptor EP4 subtype-like n=1 Tax=Mytilus californianus TaxID=6549 RepID=UPI002246EC62|nr:prostaglandin E2 receptor EP4 subtype-like [Mytilus californianus]